MMNDMYKIVRAPVVTEKSQALKAETNKMVFEVAATHSKAVLGHLGASEAEPDPRRLPRLRKARQAPGRIEIRP